MEMEVEPSSAAQVRLATKKRKQAVLEYTRIFVAKCLALSNDLQEDAGFLSCTLCKEELLELEDLGDNEVMRLLSEHLRGAPHRVNKAKQEADAARNVSLKRIFEMKIREKKGITDLAVRKRRFSVVEALLCADIPLKRLECKSFSDVLFPSSDVAFEWWFDAVQVYVPMVEAH